MSWISAQSDSVRIEVRDLPRLLQEDLSFIWTWPAVVPETVQCFRTERQNCAYAICFHFLWDQPAQTPESGVRRPEKVAFWYGATASRSIAPQVRADRDDFPPELPHLNGIAEGEPAWFCLAREGLSTIYARRGMRGVLPRLSKWLSDAAAGRLDHDGWEPTPHDFLNSATLDIGAFQRFALSSKGDRAGLAFGMGHALFDTGSTGSTYFHFHLIAKKREQTEWEDRAQLAARDKRREIYPARWLMVWGPRSKPIWTRFRRNVTAEGSLLNYAKHAGCERLVKVILQKNLEFANSGGPAPFALLIGTWRPKALVGTIPGIAKGEAAKLELAGFTVWPKKRPHGTYVMDEVYGLRLLADANSENLNRFAGYAKPPSNTVVVGIGAIGSKLAEHIVREGTPTLKIVDHDLLMPHNLSRHQLTSESTYFSKANELRTRLIAVNPMCRVDSFHKNVARITVGKLESEICGREKGVIIDATADVSVMRRLCESDNKMRVVKVELADGGRLGFLYNEGSGRRPRIDDLKAIMPTLGLKYEEISNWLQRSEDSRVETGIGCASASMSMSDSRVALHTANFMASIGKIIRFEDHPAGIGVGVLDASGHMKAWHWLEEEATHVHDGTDGVATWRVRIVPSAIAVIKQELEARKPNEAGGYLYGAYDLALRTIYVVAAIPVGPRDASTTKIRLPPAGLSGAEIELRKLSGEQVTLLGAWHTHPGGSATASYRDNEQFEHDAPLYARDPRPHVMLVLSESGNTLRLGLPEAWV